MYLSANGLAFSTSMPCQPDTRSECRQLRRRCGAQQVVESRQYPPAAKRRIAAAASAHTSAGSTLAPRKPANDNACDTLDLAPVHRDWRVAAHGLGEQGKSCGVVAHAKPRRSN